MNGVMCFKAKTDKDGLKTFAYQVAQVTTECVHRNIKLVDCIVTFGGEKDIIREVKKIDAKRKFDYLIVYSRTQIGFSETEMLAFMDYISNNFDITVVCLRSPKN
jgi:hypothetical protein